VVLQALLPHVWWPGCKDETASEERLKASVSVITATLTKVEQCQYELMQLLLATPFQQNTSSSSGEKAEDADCALLVFLRLLLQKNRAALRDVPPPGLSEPTVIMSTFFGLLRLLQPALHAAQEQGCGPLAAFPAAELLAGSDASAEAQPVYDVPRLGGTISHLAREHPTSDLEKQPVHVLPQQQQRHGSSWDAAGHELRDAWVPELLNSCMLLYAWRVGFSYKMIHSLSSSVASSSATVDELDRMIAAGSGTGDAAQVRRCNAVLLLRFNVAVLVVLLAHGSSYAACCAGAAVCLLFVCLFVCLFLTAWGPSLTSNTALLRI
jgi:Kip1 ubiquitination-promoting complex protein 1